jgi:CO/xanthine dehydrogenase Mo-binding subunit
LTGSFTSLAQIAAEALGVSVERVVMSKASPDYAPFAPMSAGSQTIYAMGPAVKDAAADLRNILLKHAANGLAVSEDALELDDEGIYVAARPSSKLSFEMLFQSSTEWFATRGPLIGQGSAPLRQRAPSFSASVAEVAIDPETGFVRLTRLVTAQDAGKAINPMLVKGQIQGGSVQSAGFALWEEIQYNEAGQILNPSLLDYHMATAEDLPMIEAMIVEVPSEDGPYGAKIVGEPSIIPPVAAIANAIRDALGVRMCDLPISPERIWRAAGSGNPR